MGKPVQVMKFLHSTKNDVLTLNTSKGVHKVEWSMDSSFGVCTDLKSHVRGTMGFEGRKDSPINVLAKQKLNAESSTAAESVGDDCAPPLALCVPLFLKAQGHDVESNIIAQDNKSAISLAQNGKLR